uniref:ATP-dependent DNA helicase n=1 Tax=Glycine max TaxID=3847 RepID=A0A0R0EHY4_SOYBN
MECRHCNAKMWYDERISKDRITTSPKFTLCCGDGKVELPLLQSPTKYLEQLLFDGKASDSKNYQCNIRTYNMMFAFTSAGIKLDKSINESRGPPTIRIQGQPCHRIGSLLPMPGKQPKFSQLYIFDTQNEVENRINTMSQHVEIQPEIVSTLSQMLDEYNVHAKSFRMARDRLADSQVDNIKLRLIATREKNGRTYNLPNVFEVAALIVGDFHPDSRRDIIVETQNGELQRIHELHSSYLGLQYPLLFPYGEDGYRPDILHCCTPSSRKRKRNHLTMREWFAYRLQSISNEAQTLLHSRKLFQQFIVEAYTMIEVDKYCSLQTSLDAGSSKGSSKGKRVILPSTFVGSPRYMDQLYFDGMAICSHVGFPNLFITLTCNPNWPKIRRVLAPLNLKATDRPDLISRVFRLKYEQMLFDLTKKHLLEKVVAYMHTIEFQKRGLPHVHLLLFLHPDNKYSSSDDIDHIISAEIPSHENDLELYTLVQNHMVHGPCGILQPKSPCMKEGKCSRFYPKMFHPQTVLDSNGYPIYRRRNDGRTISKNGVIIDNRYTIPYNAKLLRKYQAHINIEWCNQNTSIKYLFKYINKGYDRVTAVVIHDANGILENAISQNDEIKEYVDCRYISPCEATWRIFGFPIHARKPAVERLHFHLPGQHNVLYEDDDDIDDILPKSSILDSKFLAWMNNNKCFLEGNTIGRLIWVPPTTGELFYLRMMLTACKGATSFEDIITIENIIYPTYRETCFTTGFLQDEREFVEAIKEAKDWGTTNYLRKLFVLMLLSGVITKPEELWSQTWNWLAEDIAYHYKKKTTLNTKLHIDDEQLKNLTLLEIEKLLHANQKSLRDYPTMPYPEGGNPASCLENSLILSELNYNNDEARAEFKNLFLSMTDEQKQIYHKIIEVVNNNEGGMFFLYGYGGTGKTYIWRTLASSLREKNQIVIMVASSGIASLLLPGGRTAHSKFKISVPIFEDSTCNILQGSQLAELLNQTNLIIWDEAPMAHKFCFEALDQTLRDIIKEKKIPIKFLEAKGSRSDIINATINSSYLWPSCEVLTLTKNMRLQGNAQLIDDQETTKFAKWILDIGDGVIGNQNDGYATIEIPEYLLITEYNDPIDAIVKSTFPDLYQHHNNPEFFKSRAILASTNETSEQMEYLSSNYIEKSETINSWHFQSITTEFLNSLNTSGLPNHRIKLKIGSPIMLLRNLDQTQGLCNGTRLIVTRLAKHVIAAKIISGKNLGDNVYIPRMSMSPSQSPWPFKLLRRQFPIMLSYAMTINKSQGQSLSMGGLYLPKTSL